MTLVIYPLSKQYYNYGISIPTQWFFSNIYEKYNIVGAFSNHKSLNIQFLPHQ